MTFSKKIIIFLGYYEGWEEKINNIAEKLKNEIGGDNRLSWKKNKTILTEEDKEKLKCVYERFSGKTYATSVSQDASTPNPNGKSLSPVSHRHLNKMSISQDAPTPNPNGKSLSPVSDHHLNKTFVSQDALTPNPDDTSLDTRNSNPNALSPGNITCLKTSYQQCV